jgi:hypothetical protein
MSLIRASIVSFVIGIVSIGCAAETAETNGDCYSPTQNVERAYESGVAGCECAKGADAQCVRDNTGRNVALVCEGGHWKAVEDGPCMK